MNKHELKSLLENISSTLMESEELPGDPGFDWGEDLQQVTRELFPNGTDTIRPLTPEELDPFAPPAWWTLGQKLWTWWVRNGMPPAGPMELNYGNIRPYFYYDAEGNLQQQPWSFPRDDPRYREEHRHDYGPPTLRPESNTESNTMNKQDLKSLLENIYTALTEVNVPGEWGEDPATGQWRFFPTGSGQDPTPPSATPGGNVRLGPNGLYYPYGIPPVDLDPTNRGPKPFVLPPEVGRLLPRDPVTGEIQGNYAIT